MTGGRHTAAHAPMGRRRGLAVGAGLCCGALTAAFSGAVWPAEWSVQPAVSANVGRDTNPLLATGPHESATVTTLTPTMQIRGRTERSHVDLGLVLNYNNYSGNQVDNTNQQFLLLNSSTRPSERTTLGLDGEFRRDNLRQTVFTGTGTEGDADVGLIQRDVGREWLRFRPSWSRALTERSSLRLLYDHRDVTFSNSSGTGLVDFTNQLLAAAYSYDIDQKDSIDVTANTSRYRAPSADNTTDTARLLVGISRAFSETSRGSISVGASSTKQDIADNIDHASGFVLQANATQRSDVTKLDGEIRHDVSPSGIGLSIESDQLRMQLVRRLSSQVNFVLRTLLLRNKALQGTDPTVDRRYYEVEPAFEYQWMPQWFLRASYVYRYQKFDISPTSATSNSVFVGVVYDWQRQFFGQ